MRRGLALVRVSKVGDRGDDLISPELQVAAISGYAKQRNIQVVDWIEALDESGSQRRSRWWVTLDEAITRVEKEHLDSLLVWKFSRTARNRIKWAMALDRIEKAGATLESATEGVDTSTATGRFTRGMLAEINAYEAERIGEVWREVKQRRARLGLGDGQPRFGYDIVDGMYVPSETWGSVLRTLYEQKAAGVSARSLAAWLKDQGALTRRGNPYTPANMVAMLNTGFGAGFIKVDGELRPGIHEAVISDALWQRYVAQKTQYVPATSTKHTLSGLLVCWHCRRIMHASSTIKGPPGTLWACRGLRDGSCRGTYAWGPKVTRMLDEWVADLIAGKDPGFRAAQKPRSSPVKDAKRLDKIKDELLVIARKNRQGFYDDETYLLLRQELLEERRVLQAQPEQAPPVSILTQYEEHKNESLKRLLRMVLVRTGEKPKYLLVKRWDPEADFPVS